MSWRAAVAFATLVAVSFAGAALATLIVLLMPAHVFTPEVTTVTIAGPPHSG
jgi:hypothetical protein